MSWRSRTHPSGIKTPACPSRGWRLPEHTAASVSSKSPCSKPREGFLLAAGSPRWQCPLLLLGALGSTQELELWLQGCPGWLSKPGWAGYCSCLCSWLFWAQLALPILAFPWCSGGCEGGGGKPVAVLQSVVNQKPALCGNLPFLVLWFVF